MFGDFTTALFGALAASFIRCVLQESGRKLRSELRAITAYCGKGKETWRKAVIEGL